MKNEKTGWDALEAIPEENFTKEKIIELQAIRMMTTYGLYDWKFVWNNRIRAYGVCDYGKKEIGLSKPLCTNMPMEATKNTILHEIAHALVGTGHGHGPVWRAKALEIGCDGKVGHFHDVDRTKVKAKYKATCPQCKRIHLASRRIKHTYACGCRIGDPHSRLLVYKQQY